ncbi:MAG: DUF6958 family protein [Pseudomonadales bacterium]
MVDDRTICRTSAKGKQPTSIPTWKYTFVRAAILRVVPCEEPGIPAKDLPRLIRPLLSAEVLERLGSVSWHTTTVKLNMEALGELRRITGLTPQHVCKNDVVT